MSRLERKAQLMQNLREANPRLNVEDLIELMGIVAEEAICEADQTGFWNHTHDKKNGEVE